MKRSQINQAIRDATRCFKENGWSLPPKPKWDVTDFGLAEFDRKGLVLLNLAEEPEYCEKLMYARKDQLTLAHTHRLKKEDIICRAGELHLKLWKGHPEKSPEGDFQLQVNGEKRLFRSGDTLSLQAGERVTLTPGIFHAFWPASEECVIGEVSNANDDVNDNIFADENIGRFPDIEEDEPIVVKLVSDKP